jgi:ubiquinone/menaquinone biosynthesis C-methylase UbiE
MADADAERGERTDAWSDMSDPARALAAARRLERRAAAPSEVAARRRFLDLLDPRPGEMVVDVGAGSGLIALDLAARVTPGGRIFAVDPSAALLDQARAAALAAGVGPMIDCRVADGRKLPFGPAAFDAAFSHWVLLHVDRPEAMVTEMKRVTRRGGRVLAVEMDWETAIVHPGYPGLTRRILHHSADRNVDGWIGRRLLPLFRDCGFRDIVVEPIVAVDQGGGDRSWLEYLEERAKLALDAKAISPTEAAEWSAELEAAFAAGRFFFSVTQFAVLGRVPG